MIIAIEAAHANKKNRTGVEIVCYNIIEELKKIIPSDQRVILYSNQSLRDKLAILPNKNWSVKVLKWPFCKGWSQIRLSWEFLWHKPDIFLTPGQLVPFVCPQKTITVVHDSAFRVFPQVYSRISRYYLHLMNWLISKKSKIIITPSQFSKQEFLKYYNFNEEDIKVVSWGYDKKIYKFSETSLSKILISKLQIKKPYILSIGRLEEKKNTINVIKAFNLLKQNLLNNLKLILVGLPGVGYNQIKQAIDNSPYKHDIIIPGYVDTAELPVLLQNAEMFVFPSLYEGFGLPVLEAMACGCPVIVSKDNSLVEVGSEAVEYVNYDDIEGINQKMWHILSDKQLCNNLVNKGKIQSAQFDWLKTGRQIWEILSNEMRGQI